MINKIKHLFRTFVADEYRAALFVLLVFLAFFANYALDHKIEGDSLLYVESIQVLQTGFETAGFIPMMILSTYLGLRLLMFLSIFTGDLAMSWLLLDAVLYTTMGLFFYGLLKRMFDQKIALLGTLLLVLNYGAVAFGMAYMMDTGGWTAYIAALYFGHRYLEEGSEDKWLYFASVAIGLGGLYKEYAFVAYVVLLGIIIFKNHHSFREIFWKTAKTGCLAFGPFFLANVYTYFNFHGYTYLNWFLHNQDTYIYQNRLVEFIKSFGSIYNFGWFIFLPGFYIFIKRSRKIWEDKNIFFIWLTILSGFSVLLWPVVTRVLFVTMPVTIIISCLFIQKLKRPFLVIGPLILVYALTSFFMDAYILDVLNLPF